MRALHIVSTLLEQDDFTDVLHYASRAAETPEEVLGRLGFSRHAGASSYYKIVPLKHSTFTECFGEPNEREHTHTFIRVKPVHDDQARDDYRYHPDTGSATWRLHVEFGVENLYVTTGRDCVENFHPSGRGSLADRLAATIPPLLAAIEAEDGSHSDVYDFCNAVDKRWGNQPNRIIRRKKKEQP